MKKILIALVTGTLIITGCAHNEENGTWGEMEAFHATLSAAFHPAEEGNLKPVKDSAEVLERRAITWQSAEVPGGYDGSVAAPLLARLSAQAARLHNSVKQAESDSVLTLEIIQLHEIYHELAEKCNKTEANKSEKK